MSDCEISRILDRFDQGDGARRDLAEGADHLWMSSMADEQDMPSFLDQALSLPMHLGDEGAGGIDIGQPTGLRRCRDRLGHAVCGENHRSVVRHLVQFVDEDRAERSKPFDHEAVVDDLVPHIDGRTEPLEGKLDDLDRPVDARAEAARRGNQYSKRGKFIHGAGHLGFRPVTGNGRDAGIACSHRRPFL